MAVNFAPYKTVSFIASGTSRTYEITGSHGHAVGYVTADGDTEKRMAYRGAAAFRGLVQDVNQVVHYDGYLVNDEAEEAENDEFVSECLSAVARYVHEQDGNS